MLDVLDPGALGRASSDRCCRFVFFSSYRFPNHKCWKKKWRSTLCTFLVTAVVFYFYIGSSTHKFCDGNLLVTITRHGSCQWSPSTPEAIVSPESKQINAAQHETLRWLRGWIGQCSSNPGFTNPRPYVATRRVICLHSRIDRLTSLSPIILLLCRARCCSTLTTYTHILLTSEARV